MACSNRVEGTFPFAVQSGLIALFLQKKGHGDRDAPCGNRSHARTGNIRLSAQNSAYSQRQDVSATVVHFYQLLMTRVLLYRDTRTAVRTELVNAHDSAGSQFSWVLRHDSHRTKGYENVPCHSTFRWRLCCLVVAHTHAHTPERDQRVWKRKGLLEHFKRRQVST
jgi:hypothetical protein